MSAQQTDPPVTPSSLAALNPFRVLVQYRNFRLFWVGQTTSLVGTWMQSVAQGWLALVLTDDPFMVGLVSAAGSFPVLVLSLLAGVVIDRADKLRLVIVSQSLLLAQATTLWWFAWSGHLTIDWLLALALISGTVNALDIPARQSTIVELVSRDDLPSAIALNSSGFNLARIIGPGIAAAIIAAFGIAWCFAVNALSYLAVLIGLLRIELPPRTLAPVAISPLEGLRQGLAYLNETRTVAVLIRMVAVYSVFGIPYLVVMPVIARDVLHSDATGYSGLLTAVGIGGFAGALALAAAAPRIARGRLLQYAAYAFPLLLIAFSLSRWMALSAALLLAIGFTMILNNALTNGLIQTTVPDELRGRVMSAYTWVFVGLGPIGAMVAGSLASALGAPWAIALGAMVTLLYAAFTFTRYPELREL
ncbi:MAG TPA: MFS transporter [Gemmatimonadaceae bacterium]|nr:MFS transporter [Gemmatimonadaceae bacterium]